MRENLPVIAAVAVVALVVGAGLTGAVAMGTQQLSAGAAAQTSSSETISVSASGSAETTPNQVTVRVAVVATGEDAPAVRQRLATNVSQMRSALTDIGISDDQIQTNRYDLNRDRREPRREGQQPATRYRGVHSFTITVNDPNRTGQVIDTAVTNGADNVEDIRFTLSEEKRRSLRKEALRDAMINARSQATTLANASDLRITGVHSVQTTERARRPLVERAAAGGGGDGGTDVASGPVGVRVQVQVTYNATAA